MPFVSQFPWAVSSLAEIDLAFEGDEEKDLVFKPSHEDPRLSFPTTEQS